LGLKRGRPYTGSPLGKFQPNIVRGSRGSSGSWRKILITAPNATGGGKVSDSKCKVSCPRKGVLWNSSTYSGTTPDTKVSSWQERNKGSKRGKGCVCIWRTAPHFTKLSTHEKRASRERGRGSSSYFRKSAVKNDEDQCRLGHYHVGSRFDLQGASNREGRFKKDQVTVQQ